MSAKDLILSFLAPEPARRLSPIEGDTFSHLSEIRLRADKPMFVKIKGAEHAILNGALVLAEAGGALQNVYRPSARDISETVERMSRHSLYAFESALRMGYMTLPGGHRAGIAGQAVQYQASAPHTGDKPDLRTVTNISSVNLRVAHSVAGCADGVLPKLFTGGLRPALFHTLIISPPACGKTTMLRDIIRQVSNAGLTVGLVDERSEVAGCYRGVPQNDVGLRTDVLDCCPKAVGMVMLLRAMAPDVIAVDELGGEGDARAAADALNAGVKLLCTAHGRDTEDLKRNQMLKNLMGMGIFERFIVLTAPGRAAAVYDGGGSRVD